MSGFTEKVLEEVLETNREMIRWNLINVFTVTNNDTVTTWTITLLLGEPFPGEQKYSLIVDVDEMPSSCRYNLFTDGNTLMDLLCPDGCLLVLYEV